MLALRKVLAIGAAGAVGASAVLAGCGGDEEGVGRKPVIGRKGDDARAGGSLGFPTFATKNTTRVGGGDPTANAAAIAQAVYSGQVATARPPAVTLVNSGDWQGGIAASVLMSKPTRAPVLLSSADSLPAASRDALATLKPLGSQLPGGAQVIRVGSVATPGNLKATDVKGSNPFALAEAIDKLQTTAARRPSERVVVTTAERAEFAMPAAAWAAKSGEPVLYVTRDGVPPETERALKTHRKPKIYLLGPPGVISAKVEQKLKSLGTVKRISAPDPVSNAIAFARFIDGPFGWGVVDPGHGLVFAHADRPLDAAAAAPLSATGKYGPLLLVSGGNQLPQPLVQYLLDIQPGYEKDPVRGVYNHGWLIGDAKALSPAVQTRIDALLEIIPVSTETTPAPPAPPPTPPARTTPNPPRISRTPPRPSRPSRPSRPTRPARPSPRPRRTQRPRA